MFFKKEQEKSKFEYLVVGLGNPEPKYDNTRHNAGFHAIDTMVKHYSLSSPQLKFKGELYKAKIKDKECLLLKPLTYMNLSGESIIEVMNYYKIPIENVIVIFDDISLEIPKIRIRRKGSHGGHNGIRSIVNITGTEKFPRIKIGVGQKPHPDYDLADWVLSKFTQDENTNIQTAYDNCIEIVELIITDQTTEAMNKYN